MENDEYSYENSPFIKGKLTSGGKEWKKVNGLEKEFDRIFKKGHLFYDHNVLKKDIDAFVQNYRDISGDTDRYLKEPGRTLEQLLKREDGHSGDMRNGIMLQIIGPLTLFVGNLLGPIVYDTAKFRREEDKAKAFHSLYVQAAKKDADYSRHD